MLSIIALAAALSSAPLAPIDGRTDGPADRHIEGTIVSERWLKPDRVKAAQYDWEHGLTVEIQASGRSALVLVDVELDGAEWDYRPPVAGATIEAGSLASYPAGVTNDEAALGGRLTLSTQAGSTFQVEFGWVPGNQATCTINGTLGVAGTTLKTVTVRASLDTLQMSDFPLCTVMVTDIPAT